MITRRNLIGLGAGGVLLSACDRIAATETAKTLFAGAESLSYRTQRLIGGDALAPEFAPAQMSPTFRTNGNVLPRAPEYARHVETGFRDWRLKVGGLVRRPLQLSLADLRGLPRRTQITRHDCVEGWSAIGQWSGPRLATLLDFAGLLPAVRYIVFHCADDFGGRPYYESIDLADAAHPQTILAVDMNGRPLPIGHGAPVRLRVERQLGYKQAKFVMAVEAVADLAGLYGGKGGFWEDVTGYEWYAGI